VAERESAERPYKPLYLKHFQRRPIATYTFTYTARHHRNKERWDSQAHGRGLCLLIIDVLGLQAAFKAGRPSVTASKIRILARPKQAPLAFHRWCCWQRRSSRQTRQIRASGIEHLSRYPLNELQMETDDNIRRLELAGTIAKNPSPRNSESELCASSRNTNRSGAIRLGQELGDADGQ
jgi:hypothetical protein